MYPEPKWSIDRAEVLVEGLDHPECVAVHPDGSVWAGGEAGQIYRIPKDGNRIEEIANTGGFILGIAFSPDASRLLICDNGNTCLWWLDLKTNALERSPEVDGHRLRIPNYASFKKDGSFFLSDSGEFGEVSGKIIRYDEDGRSAVWHEGPFSFANGNCLAPDESALYVVCSFLPGVERIEINPDGSPGSREVFVQLPRTVPDGAAFDSQGNLLVSCYAPNHLYRVSPDGSPDLLIDDWEAHTLSNPTNIAFGPPGSGLLYSANLGRWHITRIRVDMDGSPLPHLLA